MRKYVANTGDDQWLADYQQILAREQVNMDTEAMRWILSDKRGRWFLQRMFQACQLNGNTFTGNSGTFYNEGRRDVAVSFYQLIRMKLKEEGIRLLHQAELEMLDFEKRCEEAARDKEENDDY